MKPAMQRAARIWQIDRWNRLLKRADKSAQHEVMKWLIENAKIMIPRHEECK